MNNDMTSTMTNTPATWAVQPAAWFNFDPDGVVYCADIDTAYRIAAQLKEREGDQMIWKMTAGDPIKWVRVYADERIEAANISDYTQHLV